MSTAGQQRRWRFALGGPRRPLEASCRRVHEFATRYPNVYPWRVRIFSAMALMAPFCSAALLGAVALGFPWAFREGELLRPIYEQPVLRWAVLGCVYSVLIPALAMYLSGVLRGLALRLPKPEGVQMPRSAAPRLFRLLAETCRSLDAPAVEEVRISPHRTLEIRRQPCGTSGVLGRARTVLIVGLPLLEELSPQHLRALVTHEVAHLATHKRRFGGRVLGLRTRLAALRQAAEESALKRAYWTRIPDETLLDILDKILGRLSPETFAAVRQHEAEADAIAATIAGRDFAVAALVRQRLAGHAVTQQFQGECMRLAESCPEPPGDLFERRAAAARGAFTESQIHGWLRTELEQKDNLAESHGPLWDRLRLLGCRLESLTDFHDLLAQIQPQGELGETAARYFLGDTAESLRAAFFSEWKAHQAEGWRKRFEAYEKLRRTAAEWESGTAPERETPEELWEIAVAVGNTRNWRAALPLAQRILESCPEHAEANLLTGQLQIEDADPAGPETLERAMRSDLGMVPVACTLAARFLEGRGDRDGAARYQKRCEEYRKCEQALAREREHVRSTESFSPADCPWATANALRQAVETHGSHIRSAYLMKKQTAEGDRRPLYVLGVERRNLPYENTVRANQLLLERIVRVPGVPGDVLVCVVTRANRPMLERWKSVPRALLYPVEHAATAAWRSPAEQKPGASTAGMVREEATPATLPPRSSPAAAE
jgi:Zn-dependent protease with chaperone function